MSAALYAVLLVAIVFICIHQRRKRNSKQSEANYETEADKREPRIAIPVEMDVNNSVELETPKRPTERNADFLGGL